MFWPNSRIKSACMRMSPFCSRISVYVGSLLSLLIQVGRLTEGMNVSKSAITETISDSTLLPHMHSTLYWPALQSLVCIRSQRIQNEERSILDGCLLSSVLGEVKLLLQAVRSHRHFENGMKEVLDLAFREDDSRLRKGHTSHNSAILPRIAYNLFSNRTKRPYAISKQETQGRLESRLSQHAPYPPIPKLRDSPYYRSILSFLFILLR